MKEKFEELYELMKLNRENSPWAKQQTLESYFEMFQEEIEEIKQALDNNDLENLKEEVGDALGDWMFFMAICEDKGLFTVKEVIEQYIKKFNKRKPWIHEEHNLTPDEEVARWNIAKEKEKSNDTNNSI